MTLIKQPEHCEHLNDIRAGIDLHDRQILDALQQRLLYVKAAARFKPDEASIPAPDRVAAMLEERRAWAREVGLDEGFVEGLFERIIRWNIEQQIVHWRATRVG